jgi:hypothetical protein
MIREALMQALALSGLMKSAPFAIVVLNAFLTSFE